MMDGHFIQPHRQLILGSLANRPSTLVSNKINIITLLMETSMLAEMIEQSCKKYICRSGRKTKLM